MSCLSLAEVERNLLLDLLSKKEEALIALKKKEKELTSKVESLEKWNQFLLDGFEELNKQLKEVKEGREGLKEEVERLKKEVNSQKTEVTDRGESRCDQESNTEDLDINKEMVNLLADAVKEVIHCKQKLNEAQGKLDELEESWQKKMIESKQIIEELEKEKKELEVKLSKKEEKDISLVSSNYASLESQKKALEQENDDLKDYCNWCSQSMDKANAECAALKRDKEQLEKICSEFHKQIEKNRVEEFKEAEKRQHEEIKEAMEKIHLETELNHLKDKEVEYKDKIYSLLQIVTQEWMKKSDLCDQVKKIEELLERFEVKVKKNDGEEEKKEQAQLATMTVEKNCKVETKKAGNYLLDPTARNRIRLGNSYFEMDPSNPRIWTKVKENKEDLPSQKVEKIQEDAMSTSTALEPEVEEEEDSEEISGEESPNKFAWLMEILKKMNFEGTVRREETKKEEKMPVDEVGYLEHDDMFDDN